MKKATLLATASLAIVLGACSDSKFDGYTRAENGLHYKFFNQDEAGTKVQLGDGIVIRYIISREDNDSVIVDSKNVSQDGTGEISFTMRKSSFVGSFEDGMMMMAKGDSAAFIVSADSFFLKTNGQNELPKGFSPGLSLKGVFKIQDIRTAKEMEEEQMKQQEENAVRARELEASEKTNFDKYLADNKIKTKPTTSGLIYIELKKGAGVQPKATDVVKVHYTGKLLDGTTFDSSEGQEPVEFPLNQVIPGWTEGLQLMKKGGKARLILPSSLGYGPQGGGPIPPFSPLVFEVELLEVKTAPQAPAAGDHDGHDHSGHDHSGHDH
jgi:FKBP-type peptidyl-prolyl cis-trans isomerase FkpA